MRLLKTITAALVVALVLVPTYSFAAPSNLVNAIISLESRGNPNVTGRHGEIGLMQIKCQTARSVGFKGKCRELYNPHVNVKYGTRYLDIAISRSKGNLCHAATLYNRGVYARPQNSKYCSQVMSKMKYKKPNRK